VFLRFRADRGPQDVPAGNLEGEGLAQVESFKGGPLFQA